MVADPDHGLVGLTLYPVATRMQVWDLAIRYIGTLNAAGIKPEVLVVVAVVDLEVAVTAVTVPEWQDEGTVVKAFVGTADVGVFEVPEVDWDRSVEARH